MTIKKLEEELQVKLFERNVNEITVTLLGKVRQMQSVPSARPALALQLRGAAFARRPA